jgi:hypothetical protein
VDNQQVDQEFIAAINDARAIMQLTIVPAADTLARACDQAVESFDEIIRKTENPIARQRAFTQLRQMGADLKGCAAGVRTYLVRNLED